MFLNVLCELLLVGTCGAAAWLAWRRDYRLAALGFTLMGLSALLGAAQYGGLEAARDPHHYLTYCSGRLGLLLIAIGRAQDALAYALLAVIAVVALLLPDPAVLGVNLLALIAIAYHGWSQRWLAALAGSTLFLLAGLVVGTQGQWLGMARLDLFHLVLALAIVCWIAAGLSPPGLNSQRLSAQRT